MFLQLKAYLSKRNFDVQGIITEHLEKLIKKLKHYYNDALIPTNKQDWTIDPFASSNFHDLPLQVEKELIEMTAEASNRISFESFKKHPNLQANIYFWVSIYSDYPTMTKYVIKQLIPFATTYLCKAGFSAMSVLKSKHKNRLNVEHDTRLCLSKITPKTY